jgi:hypothetical protein
LLDLRRRVRGHGSDRLGILWGPVFYVSPEFGHAIQTLVFAGQIRLVFKGRKIHVVRVHRRSEVPE